MSVLKGLPSYPTRFRNGFQISNLSGRDGTRTRNLLLAKQLRYQLRHEPKICEERSPTVLAAAKLHVMYDLPTYTSIGRRDLHRLCGGNA